MRRNGDTTSRPNLFHIFHNAKRASSFLWGLWQHDVNRINAFGDRPARSIIEQWRAKLSIPSRPLLVWFSVKEIPYSKHGRPLVVVVIILHYLFNCKIKQCSWHALFFYGPSNFCSKFFRRSINDVGVALSSDVEVLRCFAHSSVYDLVGSRDTSGFALAVLCNVDQNIEHVLGVTQCLFSEAPLFCCWNYARRSES